MRMITIDGLVAEGNSAAEIVEELNRINTGTRYSAREFMDQVSERVLYQTGKEVRTSTPEEFIADLIEYGILREERAQ